MKLNYLFIQIIGLSLILNSCTSPGKILLSPVYYISSLMSTKKSTDQAEISKNNAITRQKQEEHRKYFLEFKKNHGFLLNEFAPTGLFREKYSNLSQPYGPALPYGLQLGQNIYEVLKILEKNKIEYETHLNYKDIFEKYYGIDASQLNITDFSEKENVHPKLSTYIFIRLPTSSLCQPMQIVFSSDGLVESIYRIPLHSIYKIDKYDYEAFLPLVKSKYNLHGNFNISQSSNMLGHITSTIYLLEGETNQYKYKLEGQHHVNLGSHVLFSIEGKRKSPIINLSIVDDYLPPSDRGKYIEETIYVIYRKR